MTSQGIKTARPHFGPRLAHVSLPLSSARAACVSAVAGLALVTAAIAVPRLTDDDVRVHWPPLHADWDPRADLRLVPAIAIGLVLWLVLPRLAKQASWRGLLDIAFVST